MTRIRVVLADDHSLVRDGLRSLFAARGDIEVVGEAGTGPEAVDLVAATLPRLLCLDLSMPGWGVAPTVARVKAVSPATRVLVLTMHDDPAYARAALAAGADGYVLKTTRADDLVAAIRAVAAGQRVVDPALADTLGDAPTSAPEGHPPLSRREQDVLALLARGHTHQEIADRLHVSVKSVETYRARVKEKLGLKTRADYVRYGIELGLHSPGSANNPGDSLG
ncbi:MAG TPA: response regulator transcription factor [Urbifossiella sp.]|nr:response regulator transcription factor [Urbifossiella sp.]